MSVEDFTDRTQNVARAVGKSEVEEIYNCIHHTIQSIGLFMNVKIDAFGLKESLFGIDRISHPHVEPKLNVWQENYETNQHVATTNPVLTSNNSLMDLRAAPSWSMRQPPTGHLGVPVPQHRAVTTGAASLWAERSFDHQSTKRMRIAEAVPATQSRGPTWGGTGWTQGWGGAPTGDWGGTHGAASVADHLQRSQEMRPAWDPWERRLQQPPYGSSSNTYGPPFL